MIRGRRCYCFNSVCLISLAMALGFLAEMSAGLRFQQELFLPKTAPAGFILAQPPEFYGTESEPLADGHIFHFIDGGGVVYLNHGFQAVAHILYKDEKANSLTVDIYDMGTAQNARTAFADEAICPAGFTVISVETEAKAYHFEPDFFLYFVKDRYLIYAHVADDGQSGLLIGYARQLFKEEP